MLELEKQYRRAVEVADGVHWVSPRIKGKLVHCNAYLLVLKGEDSRPPVSVLIDPGGTSELQEVSSKVLSVIGNLNRLSIISINHQDPDVFGSLPLLSNRFSTKSLILMTEDSWRLVALCGIKKDRVRFPEKHLNGLRIKNVGRTLHMVMSPYCHFTGAFMIFEPVTGCLFSGDLFGGVTLDDDMYSLHATEHNWKGIKFFHERYMPCNAALRHAIGKIRRLEGLKHICPQHGSIISGDLIGEFLDRMERLQVGADLLEDREMDPHTRGLWNTLASRILETADELLGIDVVRKVAKDPDLAEFGTIEGTTAKIEKLPSKFVEALVVMLCEGQGQFVSNQLKICAIMEAETLALSGFSLDLGVEEQSDDYEPLEGEVAEDQHYELDLE